MAVDGAARRRRERRLRGRWKYECLSVRMAVAAAMHHSSGKRSVTTTEVAVQTDIALTVFPAPPPVNDYVDPAPVMVDITCLLEPPVPPVLTEYVAPAPVVFCDEPVPVIEYMTPGPDVMTLSSTCSSDQTRVFCT